MSTETTQQYWFQNDVSNEATMPFIATGVGSSLGSGAGQDLTTEEYVGPLPYLIMNAEAESKPTASKQAASFAARILSYIPYIRIRQALSGTGQDVASTVSHAVSATGQRISEGVQAVTHAPSKILGSVKSGINKIVLVVIVVVIGAIFLLSFLQARATKLGGA